MKVKDLTVEDLTALISQTVEQTISEMLKDPDRELRLGEEVEQRLRESLAAFERGEQGLSLDKVAKSLPIDAS